MEQKTEALYLINRDRFLHLRENDAGVGFATYDCANGAPLESGQISKQNLPPAGRNARPAARNWYLFELSSDDRKAIQGVIPDAPPADTRLRDGVEVLHLG